MTSSNSAVPTTLAVAGVGGLGALCVYGVHRARTEASKLPFQPKVKRRITKVYARIAGGIAITGLTTYGCYKALRLGFINHGALMAGSMVIGIPSLCAASWVPKQHKVAKNVAWTAFVTSLGISLAPMGYLPSTLLAEAGVLTGVAVMGLSAVAITAPDEAFLWLGAPLGVSLAVVTGASLLQLFLPRGSAFYKHMDNVTLYGGLAAFMGLLLYDTRKVIVAAKQEREFDAVAHSLELTLDIVNLFVDIVRLLFRREKNRQRPKAV